MIDFEQKVPKFKVLQKTFRLKKILRSSYIIIVYARFHTFPVSVGLVNMMTVRDFSSQTILQISFIVVLVGPVNQAKNSIYHISNTIKSTKRKEFLNYDNNLTLRCNICLGLFVTLKQ